MGGEQIPRLENPAPVRPRSLWFGSITGIVAWGVVGIVDVLLAWQACLSGPVPTGVYAQTGMHILLGFVTFGFLALTIASGVVGFKNWRALSLEHAFKSAEGRGRREFMSLAGVFINIALGIGIIWFSLAVYMIKVCVHAH